MDNLLPFWVENYFRRENYLRVSGKPLPVMYGVRRFIDDLGGAPHAKDVIGRMRQYCRDKGLGGLVILGEQHTAPSDPLASMAAIGLDGVTSYHWPTFAGLFPGDPNPAKIVAAQEHCWRERAKAQLPGPITISARWDSRPWQPRGIRWQLHPVPFKDLCSRARAFAEAQPSSNPFSKIVLIDNWNEFGEGHYIFPHREYGFAHLDAVREVFSPNAPPHRDIIPEEVGLGPYNRLFVEQMKRSKPVKRLDVP